MKFLFYNRLYLNVICLISVFTISSTGQTYITGGDVSGTWTASGSPYNILSEITVPDNQVLIIEPGVSVVFLAHNKFNVQGRLLAIGTQQDSIHFTAENIQTGWHGIRFNNTPATNDSSKLIYCSFRNGKANTGDYNGTDRSGGAIFLKGFSKLLISNSLFENNMNDGNISTTGGAVIFIDHASPIITNCTFRYNQGTTDCSVLCNYSYTVISSSVFSNNSGPHGPILCLYYAPTISGNIMTNNTTTRAGGGIFMITSHSKIINNIIANNSCFGGEGEGGGIKSWESDKSEIINNTIVNNSATKGGGICCNLNADPILINNIIWGNSSPNGNQVNLLEATSDPDIAFCDIQGGKEEFGGSGAGGNFEGLYLNNIDTIPYFLDVAGNDFQLSDNSPCIGAGVDSIEINSIWYYVPSYCFEGSPRPDPPGSIPDIGACENHLGTPLVGVEDELIPPIEFALEQNYPNPFNPTTTIKYSIPQTSQVQMKVFDVLGNEIETLVNEEKPEDTYELTWNAEKLPSGVYFYQLKAGSFLETKKMILIK